MKKDGMMESKVKQLVDNIQNNANVEQSLQQLYEMTLQNPGKTNIYERRVLLKNCIKKNKVCNGRQV